MTTPAGDTPTDPTAGAAADQTAAPAADTSTTAVRDLATVMDTPPPTTASFIKGTITAVALAASPPTCSIQVSGDTTTTVNNVRMNDAYTPVVGDTVIIGKQDTNIFVICQLNDSGTGGANGWTAPSLGTNVTTNGNSNGAIQYRLSVDQGDNKIQWRGAVAVASGATAICTMPAGFRPSVKRSLLLARDINGSTEAIAVDFNTDGTVTLTGSAPVETSDSTTPAATGSASGGSTGSYLVSGATDSVSHSHGGDTTLTTINHNFTDPNGSHTHTIGAHTHTSAAHTHTITIPAAVWVSFNNVEYYL